MYHLSIIDYLQTWDIHKKTERLSKILLYSRIQETMSALPPTKYQLRFANFMAKHVIKRPHGVKITKEGKKAFINEMMSLLGANK